MRGTSSSSGCTTPTVSIITPPSPMPNRVGTNYAPSLSEANLIRSTLSQVDSNISLLDHEMDRLRDILNSISRNRETLRKFSAEHQALLSRVRYLPTELLAEIFCYCSPEDSIDDSPHHKRATMLCSHVCRMWRQIALSTPRLWSSLSLEVRTSNYESSLSLAKSWLSRTGELPLSLRILCFDRSRNLQFLTDTILPVCHRWKNLGIVVLFSEIEDFAAAVGPVPRLETLYLSVLDTKLWDTLRIPTTRPPPVRIFEAAAKLHSVYLSDGVTPYGVQLPWSQLTEFHAGYCGVDECLETLTWLPNLVKFGVELSIERLQASGVTRPVIRLSHVTTIKLFSKLNPGWFFGRLASPSLTDFEYHGEQHGWNPIHFMSLLLRSSCSLTRLCLSLPYCGMSEDHLIQLLELTPDLRELAVEPLSMTRWALARLTHQGTNNDNAPVLVTKLHTFKIGVQQAFSVGAFADMVESRWRVGDDTVNSSSGSKHGVSRIHTVEINWPNDGGFKCIHQSLLARFREFAREGLNIQLMEDDRPLI